MQMCRLEGRVCLFVSSLNFSIVLIHISYIDSCVQQGCEKVYSSCPHYHQPQPEGELTETLPQTEV